MEKIKKKGDHSLVQLCLNLKKIGVDIISLTETNVHWRRNYIILKFKILLKKVCPNKKITYSTSEKRPNGIQITNLWEQQRY